MSDALHISGELLKSYASARPLTEEQKEQHHSHPDGESWRRLWSTGRAVPSPWG